MPRLPRISLDGAIHYVVARTSEDEVIFKDKDDYKMYLELVSKYKSQHKFKLYSYNLLPNRIELLVETGDDASISQIMHDLSSLYTKYYNGRYAKHGHLFESRFRSVLVEKVTSLLALTRHIHLRDTQNLYSSFHAFVQNHGQGLVEVEEVKNFLSNKDNPDAYEKYVLQADPKEVANVEKSLRRGSVYGSEEFKKAVLNRVQEHTEELQKAAKAKKVSPVFLYLVGGFVILAMGSTIYLYISKQQVQTQYQSLLTQKEAEFTEKTKFENQSPLALREIDGTVWNVELVDPKAGTIQRDTITFEDGRFYSQSLASQGFQSSTYLLVPKTRGIFQWQAAQTNSAGQTIYWQGLWQGDAMKGQMTLRAGSKESVFSFYSTKWNYAESEEKVNV